MLWLLKILNETKQSAQSNLQNAQMPKISVSFKVNTKTSINKKKNPR